MSGFGTGFGTKPIPLRHLRADDVTCEHLVSLISNRVSEGRDIECKRDAPQRSDSAKREFLADVSSFANANGGLLIYGVSEQGGAPTEIAGLDVTDLDEQKLWMEDILRDGD